MTNLSLLTYFCTLVEYDSMHKAAQALHISQPSLSIAIKKLEQELNMPLFIRQGRRITLTSQGHLLYKEASLLLQHAQALSRRLHESKSQKQKIKLGIAPMMSNFLMLPICQFFQTHYDSLSLEMRESGVLKLRRLLEEQTIDIAFLIKDVAHNDLFHFTDLLTTTYHLYTKKDSPLHSMYLHKKAPLSLIEIQDTPVIFYSDTSYIQTKITAAFAQQHIAPHILLRTNQIQTIKQITKTGMASSFLTKKSINTSDNLIPIPLEVDFPITIGMAINKQAPIRTDMTDFMEAMLTLSI